MVRISIGLLLILAVAYLGYMGWQGSDELVHAPNPKTVCQTPATLGWAYEAINYDRASDGTRIAGWWIPAATTIGPDER